MRSRTDLAQMRFDTATFPDLPATLDKRVHAVAMQPEQCRSELSQIVSVRAGTQPPRSPQRIGGLFLQGRKSVLTFDRAGHTHRINPRLIVGPRHGRQLAEVRSPTAGLAPNSPVRWTDQNRLIRPNVEPHVGLTPTWKTPRRNTDLARLAKLQIAIFRRELDRQPLVRNGKLRHISRVPSRGLVCFMPRWQPTSRSVVRSCRSALLPRLARFRQEVPARFLAISPAFVPARSIHQFRVLQ